MLDLDTREMILKCKKSESLLKLNNLEKLISNLFFKFIGNITIFNDSKVVYIT